MAEQFTVTLYNCSVIQNMRVKLTTGAKDSNGTRVTCNSWDCTDGVARFDLSKYAGNILSAVLFCDFDINYPTFSGHSGSVSDLSVSTDIKRGNDNYATAFSLSYNTVGMRADAGDKIISSIPSNGIIDVRIKGQAKNGSSFYTTNTSIPSYSTTTCGLNFRSAWLRVVVNWDSPSVSSLNSIGDLYERPITVNWRGSFCDSYEYECYYNNVMVLNGTTTLQSLTIPPNTYKGTLPASFRIRGKSTNPSGTVVYTPWVDKSLSLKDIEATISNLIVTGNAWEKPIGLTWLSENQQQYKVEILKNNTLVKTYTGATEKAHNIPLETLTDGLHTFKVWAGYKDRFTNYQSKDVNLINIQPTLKNVSLSGSNVDYPIEVSWESTDQQGYILEVWQGDTKKHEYAGEAENTHIIDAGVLNVGLSAFKVKVAYKDRWTEYSTTSTTLVETLPSIAVFEPDGRMVDRDLPLRVYWTSQNQSSYKLIVDGSEYTGTTDKEVIIQQGQLTSGRKQMTLTVYLDIAGKVKETSKTVEFIVQGKPPMPTITSGATYTNNRPTITFDSQDANAYRVEVIGCYDSGWCNGIVDAYKVYTYLSNGIYTIAVSVKNQFNIVSDTAIKQIQINATVPTAPTLKVYDEYKYNTLRIAGTYNHYYVFRNGVKIAKVYSDTFTDYTAQGMNIYSVQGITSNDTYNVSNEVIINNTFDYPILSINADMLELIYRQGKSDLTSQYNPMSTKEFYIGRSKPITRHGEHSDTTYSFDYTEVNPDTYHKLLEMVQEKKPILYRSNKRKIWLSFENVALTDGRFVDYSISAYEVDANEVIDYD